MSTDADSTIEDKTPIKYFLIGNSSTNKIIVEFTSVNAQVKSKKEINQIFNKLCKSKNKKLNERNKITSKEENYYFTFLEQNLIYILLSNNTYPERLIFELIHKVNNDNIPSMINDETKELTPSGRQELKQIIDFYQDPKNANSISKIQSDVDSIKVDMKKSINKMVDSVDNVNELKEKSDNLKFETNEYQKNADEIRTITWWQNVKLWIILALVILILIIVIVFVVT